jgi:hypothetical protein
MTLPPEALGHHGLGLSRIEVDLEPAPHREAFERQAAAHIVEGAGRAS